MLCLRIHPIIKACEVITQIQNKMENMTVIQERYWYVIAHFTVEKKE